MTNNPQTPDLTITHMEHEGIRDDISKGFADLTALLEDAVGLAVEGQSRRCNVEDLEDIAAFILPEVNKIIRVLTALELLIIICPRD